MSQLDLLAAAAASVPFRIPPLLARLRTETRAAHDRIEIVPELSCLLSASLSADSYVRALRALHAFHAGMWAALPHLLGGFLAEFAIEGGDFAPSDAGLRALSADLAWFAAEKPPKMPAPDVVNDAASAFGALYVVEGSALGARVIGRSVSVSLGVAPGQGGSFFCGATADAARLRWRHFAAALDWAEPRLGEAGGARVSQAAIAVFARLEQAFAQSAAAPHEAAAASCAHLSSLAHVARHLN